jgi:hypothetical protein
MSSVLVMPDIHQDVKWAQSIIEKEYFSKNCDHVVFLGDYFDYKKNKDKAGTVEDVCRFLKSMAGIKADFLFGNHDLIYAWYASDDPKKEGGGAYFNSGFNIKNNEIIKRELGSNFFKDFKLTTYIDGVLYSHAGVHPYIMEGFRPERFVQITNEKAKSFTTQSEDHVFQCGACRGGRFEFGGLTWLDWDREFLESESMPWQICGHSRGKEPRQKLKAWCIDTGQTWYAIIKDGKDIILKNPFDNDEFHDTLEV